MTGLDTNVLLRLFLEDDPEQFAQAKAMLGSLSSNDPGYVTCVTLAEAVWVLESRYRKPKSDVIFFIRVLLESRQVVVENHDAITQALRRFAESNADFADCLIERLCHSAGCTRTMTFDIRASKSSGMVLL